jgi:hypothetical protein
MRTLCFHPRISHYDVEAIDLDMPRADLIARQDLDTASGSNTVQLDTA